MKTLVLGASAKPERYSYKAIVSLLQHGHTVVAIGNKKGIVASVPIHTEKIVIENVHTITMYLGAKNQKEYYNYILALQPQRIIFNPGAENEELKILANQKGIHCIEACTLVMLSIGNYE